MDHGHNQIEAGTPTVPRRAHHRPLLALFSLALLTSCHHPPHTATLTQQANHGSLAATSEDAIRAALARMADALMQGDADAYLRCTSPATDTDATELRAFAADLASHKPEQVSFDVENVSLTPTQSLTFTTASALADLTLHWKMPGMKTRSVTYPARFNVVLGCFGPADATYAGEAWEALSAPGITVHHYPQHAASAHAAIKSFDLVREHVETMLGVDHAAMQARTAAVKVYPSMIHLQSSIYLSYSRPLGGWNEPGESIKVLAQSGTPADHAYAVVIAHEYAHLVSFEMGDHATDMPWWALEGTAELASEPYAKGLTERAVRSCRKWAKEGSLADFALLADFKSVPDRLSGRVYAQGHAMVAFITGRYGDVQRNQWLRALARGDAPDAACRAVLGLPFEQLEGDWRAMLLHEAEAREE